MSKQSGPARIGSSAQFRGVVAAAVLATAGERVTAQVHSRGQVSVALQEAGSLVTAAQRFRSVRNSLGERSLGESWLAHATGRPARVPEQVHPMFVMFEQLEGCEAAQEEYAQNALSLLEGYSAGHTNTLIWRGERVKSEDEFESCVAVGRQTGGRVSWFCSGVLIHPRIVLTAAHCNCKQTSSPDAAWRVKAGLRGQGSGGAVEVERVIDYWDVRGWPGPSCKSNPPTLGDLRILILREPLADIVPAGLAGPDDLNALQHVRIVGFGKTHDGGYGYKNQAIVPVASTNCVGDGLVDLGCTPFQDLVASSKSREDSCQGDSGGPAYIEPLSEPPVLAAITSRGVNGGTGKCGSGGIYVRVDADRRLWIDECVRLVEEPPP